MSFALYGLDDVHQAWDLARRLDPSDARLWSDLAAAYEGIDPVAVLPVHTRLVEQELAVADAAAYRRAAVRLARMRILAAGSGQAVDVEAFIAELRDPHQRRPRLQREFDRAGLP